MQRIWLLSLAVLSLAAWNPLPAATRPQYGGTLRVEVREPGETPDPPANGVGIANLVGPFSVSRWEAGRMAFYSADESAAGGRPYLDAVEIQMGRPLRDQLVDLELGKADIVELAPGDLRRVAAGRRIWTSAPVRLLALLFAARVTDPRVREALALAIDRSAIHNVLLQKQGEVAGALLPQWISGYAFLFPTGADAARARALSGSVPAQLRTFSLGFTDPGLRAIAERIALNARDAGISLAIAPQSPNPEVRLVEIRVESSDAARALAGVAMALGLAAPSNSGASPEEMLAAERGLLQGFRVIPLFHLPDIYGVNPRVKGGPAISPLGEWRFQDLWLEGQRP